MKKSLILIAFLAFAGSIYSQVTFKPGIRAGANYASISNIDQDSRFGVYAGIFGELKLGGFYALQPEINYSQQGSEDIELAYLNIGVINKFFILPKSIPLYLLIGPGFDINLDGDTTSYTTNYSTGVSFEADISFTGGVGFDFPFGLGVEARYKQGIIDTINDGDSDGRLNAVVQLGAYFKF